MNAVILCAGFATRMYPLTKNFPKPLLEVAGKPVLDYLIEQIVCLPGMQAVHLVSNGKFIDHFRQWHQAGEKRGCFGGIPIHIHNDGCVDNKSRLGAAGDLYLALGKIDPPGRVLVSGGDNIYQFSLQPLWEQFLASHHHCITSLRETEKEKLQKTGVLDLDDHNRVLRLHEKPSNPPSTWTSPPLYFLQPSIWTILERFLHAPGNHDAPGYLIDHLCQTERVQALKLDAQRLDIGCLKTYHQANRLLKKKGG